MSPAASPKVHLITSIAAIQALLPARVMRIAEVHPVRVDIPPIAFGHQDLSSHTIVEHPQAGAWAETVYESDSRTIMLLRNVVIRSETGVITVDNHILAETLLHVQECNLGDRVTDGIILRPNTNDFHIARGTHLMGGGYENYYHWMNDIVARTGLADAFGSGATPLFGILQAPFQSTTLDLLGPAPTTRRGLSTNSSLHVDELIYVPNLTGVGFRPHTCMLAVFDRLRVQAGPARAPHRRIYISRAGRPKRPLSNEAAVMDLVARYGFAIVELEGMAVRDQVLLFAEASHIIAPHGAGLTNLLFCRPGTSVCELLSDNYVNWCFRRIAAIRRLHYGCIVGRAADGGRPDWPHNTGWTAPIEELASVLGSSLFQLR